MHWAVGTWSMLIRTVWTSVFSSQFYNAYSPCVKSSIFLDQSKVLSSILLSKPSQYQCKCIHPALKGVKRENDWKDVLINLGALFPTWTFSLIYNGKDKMQWKIKTERPNPFPAGVYQRAYSVHPQKESSNSSMLMQVCHVKILTEHILTNTFSVCKYTIPGTIS